MRPAAKRTDFSTPWRATRIQNVICWPRRTLRQPPLNRHCCGERSALLSGFHERISRRISLDRPGGNTARPPPGQPATAVRPSLRRSRRTAPSFPVGRERRAVGTERTAHRLCRPAAAPVRPSWLLRHSRGACLWRLALGHATSGLRLRASPQGGSLAHGQRLSFAAGPAS